MSGTLGGLILMIHSIFRKIGFVNSAIQLAVSINSDGSIGTVDTQVLLGDGPGIIQPVFAGIVGQNVLRLSKDCVAAAKYCFIACIDHAAVSTIEGGELTLLLRFGVVNLKVDAFCLEVIQVPLFTNLQQLVILNAGVGLIVIADPQCHGFRSQVCLVVTVGQNYIIDLLLAVHDLDDTVVGSVECEGSILVVCAATVGRVCVVQNMDNLFDKEKADQAFRPRAPSEA